MAVAAWVSETLAVLVVVIVVVVEAVICVVLLFAGLVKPEMATHIPA